MTAEWLGTELANCTLLVQCPTYGTSTHRNSTDCISPINTVSSLAATQHHFIHSLLQTLLSSGLQVLMLCTVQSHTLLLHSWITLSPTKSVQVNSFININTNKRQITQHQLWWINDDKPRSLVRVLNQYHVNQVAQRLWNMLRDRLKIKQLNRPSHHHKRIFTNVFTAQYADINAVSRTSHPFNGHFQLSLDQLIWSRFLPPSILEKPLRITGTGFYSCDAS